MNTSSPEFSPYLIREPVDALYDESFECPINLPYKIDVFQQQAAKAILQEHNVLLSCHTGSGKTVPCLFAINYYLKKNKRVIYTSPVKSLSNQKYKEFSEKVPDVGIMTGDIKCNPDAQCLIMTTEILRNMLYKQTSTSSSKTDNKPAASSENALTSLDLLSTVGCVIFDEIHYINDKDRGKNWEESIVMLPPEIVILGCSGTIDEPERFASWIGDIKKRPIHLIRTIRRPIPLNHYIYVDNMDGYANYKKVTVAEAKKKAAEFDLKKLVSEASSLSLDPVLDRNDEDEATSNNASQNASPNSQNAQNAFQNHEKKGMIHIMKGDIFLARNYDIAHNIYQNKCIDPVTKKSTKMGNPRYSKSQAPGDLNAFLDFLKKGRYLPSLIFVLSRRRVEEYAAAVQITLLDHDERNEVGKLFDINLSKFGKQYKELNQYNQVRDLLMRGIGIHHSGLIPVLKEAVEILFSKGLIKLLFATETFAIGVNMPTKTVVFTEFYKPTGASTSDSNSKSSGPTTRILKTDEYLQMSGRAGRRGLDSTGTIIIFPVRELPGNGEMTAMMTGHTPAISSKFSPGYQFILKCMVNDKNLWDILNSSLRSRQDKIMEEHYKKEQKKKAIEYEERIKKLKTIYGENIIELAAEYDSFYQMTVNQTMGNMTIKPNKDKNIERKLQELGKKVPKSCYKEYVSIMELKNSTSTNESDKGVDKTTSEILDADKDKQLSVYDNLTLGKLQPVFDYLTYLGYLSSENYLEELSENYSEKPLEKTKVTTKGIIAAEINDSNCILMTEMIVQGFFDELDGPEMLALLALFIQESEEIGNDHQKMQGIGPKLNEMIDRVFYMRDDLERLEEEMVLAKKVYLDTDWSIYTDFVPIAYLWASGAHISEIYQISNIYEGNLVKNMLRLQNIAEGIVEVFKSLEKHEQANKLKETSDSIIRDIVTNNSLYVTT